MCIKQVTLVWANPLYICNFLNSLLLTTHNDNGCHPGELFAAQGTVQKHGGMGRCCYSRGSACCTGKVVRGATICAASQTVRNCDKKTGNNLAGTDGAKIAASLSVVFGVFKMATCSLKHCLDVYLSSSTNKNAFMTEAHLRALDASQTEAP